MTCALSRALGSETWILAQIRVAGGGSPPGPPKRRSARFAAAVGRFYLTEALDQDSCAAGAELLPRNPTVLGETTCSGQLRCGGVGGGGGTALFLRDRFFGRNHLCRAAALPGAALYSETFVFLEETTCPGQLRCLGQNCFQKSDLF